MKSFIFMIVDVPFSSLCNSFAMVSNFCFILWKIKVELLPSKKAGFKHTLKNFNDSKNKQKSVWSDVFWCMKVRPRNFKFHGTKRRFCTKQVQETSFENGLRKEKVIVSSYTQAPQRNYSTRLFIYPPSTLPKRKTLKYKSQKSFYFLTPKKL